MMRGIDFQTSGMRFRLGHWSLIIIDRGNSSVPRKNFQRTIPLVLSWAELATNAC